MESFIRIQTPARRGSETNEPFPATLAMRSVLVNHFSSPPNDSLSQESIKPQSSHVGLRGPEFISSNISGECQKKTKRAC